MGGGGGGGGEEREGCLRFPWTLCYSPSRVLSVKSKKVMNSRKGCLR